MNKTPVLLAAMLAIPTGAAAEQIVWPQPESAYSDTRPRAQWLETPRQQTPAQPPRQLWTPAPGYGQGYPGPYYSAPASWGWRRPYRSGGWPNWDSFSMPSPSFSAPSFSFPAPFGW